MDADLEIEQEAFPGMAAEMCLKDRERFEKEIEELHESDVELLRRLEKLEKAVRELGILL